MSEEVYTVRDLEAMTGRPYNTIHKWISRRKIEHTKTSEGTILLDENGCAKIMELDKCTVRKKKSCAQASIGRDHIQHHNQRMHSIDYVARKTKRNKTVIHAWVKNDGIAHEVIGKCIYVNDDGFQKLKDFSDSRKRIGNNKKRKQRKQRKQRNTATTTVAPTPATPAAPAPVTPAPTADIEHTVVVTMSQQDNNIFEFLKLDVQDVVNEAIDNYIADFRSKIQL
jgi:hypothetical protein